MTIKTKYRWQFPPTHRIYILSVIVNAISCCAFKLYIPASEDARTA